MKSIYIFDMDGTLTPSRREMTKEFEDFYSNWAKNHIFFLVSGSNLEKIKEQVPEYILDLSEGVFTCGGNQLWLNGELSYNHEFKPQNDLIDFLKEEVDIKCLGFDHVRSVDGDVFRVPNGLLSTFGLPPSLIICDDKSLIDFSSF
mgnify:CR=1 FL=1